MNAEFIPHSEIQYNADVNAANTLAEYALKLGPAFRDKFDFSTDDQFAKLAEVSFKAAQAFVAHRQVLMKEAKTKLELAQIEERRKAELEALQAKIEERRKAELEALQAKGREVVQ